MKITFDDKEQLITNPNIPRKNKVVADDVNEIKRVINDNDDNIAELDTRKADRTEIPTNLNQLSNADTKFVNETQMANAVQQETTARQQQDVALQNQIDAITSQSDVVDVVGTYAELMDYDTSTITENDIIKVLQDSTHDNATSYFRWSNDVWAYVGSEGPYYTKGETDERLNQKANQTSLDQTNQNLNTLAGRVGTNETEITSIKAEQTTQNRQIATLIADSGNKIELSVNSQTYILTATLKNKAGEILNTSQVDLPLEAMIVNATYDSTTKELVLTLQNGTVLRVSLADIVSGLVSQDDFDDLEVRVDNLEDDVADIKEEQTAQNAEIEELQERVEVLENTVNSELEDATATGESISVTDSANAPAKLLPSGNTYQATNIKTYECEGEETGDYYFTYDSINYQFTMPTIEEGSILAFNTDTLKLYLGDTEITTTTDNTGTLITLQDTPNPKYEQPMHVVKGENTIAARTVENLLRPEYFYPNSANGYNSIKELIESNDDLYMFSGNPGNQLSYNIVFPCKPNTDYVFKVDQIIGYDAQDNIISDRIGWYVPNSKPYKTYEFADITFQSQTYTKYVSSRTNALRYTSESGKYIKFKTDADQTQCCLNFQGNVANKIKMIKPLLYEGENVNIPYHSKSFTLTLPEGMELCKIGDYADTFEWQDDKWYKNKKIQKRIFEGGDDENWGHFSIAEGDLFRLPSINDGINDRYYVPYCNLYKGIPLSQKSSRANYNFYIENQNIDIIDNRFNTTSAFKANLTTNNISVCYPLQTPISEEITDQTLINQLNAMQKVLSYYGGTNITTISAGDLNPILNFDYKKSNRLRIEALENAVFNQ